MSALTRIGRSLFPGLVAPPALKGLPPSWSGILRRIVYSERTVHHPIRGTYKVCFLSRDEYKRVADLNFQQELDRCTNLQTDVVIEDDFGDNQELKEKVEKISAWAKTQIK